MAFDAYHKWLGIPSGRRPPTYYELLGIEPGENDNEVIHSALAQRRAFVQSKKGEGRDEQVKVILRQFDEAASTLLVPEFKAGYDRQLGLHLKGKWRRGRRSILLPSWMESRVVRIYGEGSGIVGDVIGIVSVVVAAIALMLGLSHFLYQPASDLDSVTESTWLELAGDANKKNDNQLSLDIKPAEVDPSADSSSATPPPDGQLSATGAGSASEPSVERLSPALVALDKLTNENSADKSLASADTGRNEQPLFENKLVEINPRISSSSSTKEKPAEPARAEEKKKPPALPRVGVTIEGEKLNVRTLTRGGVALQGMGGFPADKWSGDWQLYWTGGKPKDRLIADLPVEKAGKFDLLMVLTKAQDYAIVQVWLDDKKLGAPIDLYNNTDVVTTGLMKFGVHELTAGNHTLMFEIIGANVAAAKKFMVGIDAVQLGFAGGRLPKSNDGAVLNLNFEKGTLDDWVATGIAFKGQPISRELLAKRRPEIPSGHTGNYWISTCEPAGDDPRGTLTSTAFKLDLPYASFLLGGGQSRETRVELVEKARGNVLARFSGRNTQCMQLVIVDLKAHLGKEIFIRIVDNARSGWGHINFDDFQLHAEQPGPITRR